MKRKKTGGFGVELCSPDGWEAGVGVTQYRDVERCNTGVLGIGNKCTPGAKPPRRLISPGPRECSSALVPTLQGEGGRYLTLRVLPGGADISPA